MTRFALAIEMSNPSSGPRGQVRIDTGLPLPTASRMRTFLAGPGVALGEIDRNEHVPLSTELFHEGTRHDDDLMPAIDRLCRRHGARPADLARIAVSIGPGGYTSLRIAVATAKMLAEATGAEIIPVPSAAVVAWSLPGAALPALVCLASKADMCHATLFEAGPSTARPIGLVSAADIAGLRPRTLVVDRFCPEPIRAAAAAIGAPVIEPIFAAESLLHCAQGGRPIDALALAPLYAREPEAVTQWRKRRG